VHVAVKELVVVFNYALQILQTLLHRLHGLETFVNRRVEIRDGVMASRTTHWMQSEWVVIAIISTVVTAVVATTIVIAVVVAAVVATVIAAVVATTIVIAAVVAAAVGPSGVFSLGTSSQI
jgi:hypothetical protein